MSLSLETFSKAVAPIQRRLGQVVNWAKIHLVDTSSNANAVQVEMVAGEISDRVIHVENYGFSAVPLNGALGVVVCIAGEKDSAILTHTHDLRHRPRGLPSGDVCLYTAQDARDAPAEEALHRLQFTADRTVVLTAKRLKILCGSQTLIMDEDGVRVTATRIDFETPS